MGGLSGIIDLQGGPPLPDLARPLSVGVAHRGRADKGLFAEGPVVLTHRRMAGGAQDPNEPLVGERWVLAVDGRPHDAGSPALFERWEAAGIAALEDLNGEFALSAWGRKEQVLFLARDPCGTRPLYWAGDHRRMGWASEIPPLLGLPWVSRSLATDNLAEYLSFRYCHAPRTLLRDVHEIPPGHYLRLDARGIQVLRWWQPRWAPVGAETPDEGDTAERMDTLLRRSLERRMRLNAPTGLLLSGGLDSSAILYHLRELGHTVSAWTVGLHDDQVDESSFAARVAKVFETEHHVLRVTSGELVAALSEATIAMGQPLPSAAGALQHLVYEAMKAECRLILSGDGGDETLGGRGMERIASRLRRAQVVARLPGPARRLFRGLARRAGSQELAASAAHFGRDLDIGGSQVFDATERVGILRDPAMVRPGIRRTLLEPLYQEVSTDAINAILHVWQRGWLPQDSLARSDRMSAHASLVVRYPLLDQDVLNFTAGLPGVAKVPSQGTGFETKWPLRLAMKGRLPDELVHRPKRALHGPLDEWLRIQGKDWLRGRVEALIAADTPYFAPDGLRQLMGEHLDRRQNHGLKLWTVCLLQLWLEGLG